MRCRWWREDSEDEYSGTQMGVMTALKAANHQWNNLSPELTREIGKVRFVHPTALLIKDLSFYTLSVEPFVENYNAKRVVITEHGYF